MKIYRVTDKEFKQFGRVLDLDTKAIVEIAEKYEIPEKPTYWAGDKNFEALPIMEQIQNECFGGLLTQLGYCTGHNKMLNALEWHTCSEINIAITDMIVMLGDIRDIEAGNRYNSEKVMAFKVLKGEAIEIYATTLHYCPIEMGNNGFGNVVGLLKGTNTRMDFEPENPLLGSKNKWVIAHEENQEMLERGIFGGIYGVNHKIDEE